MGNTRRIVVAVVASTFFAGFGGGVVFPILPNLGTVLGISPFLVGIILSANRFTRMVANAPAGSLIDRIGTRIPLVAGLFVSSFATLGYVVALGAPLPEAWFVGARIVWGIGSALVFATAYTIASDVSGDASRGTSIGVVRGGLTLGFPTGLIVGGIVSDLYSVSTAFVVAAAFALVAGFLAYFTVPETHVSERRESVRPWDIDTSPLTLTVGLVNFGLYFAYLGALLATLVLFVEAKGIYFLGYGPQGMSGLLMGLTVLTASICTIGGGKLSDLRDSRIPILFAFLAISFVGFVLLVLAESLLSLLMACVLIGAGQGGTSGPLIALLADLTPDHRMGRAMGTNNVFGDLGGGLGPVVSLPLIDVFGFTPIYAACAIIPLLAGLTLLWGVRTGTGGIRYRSVSVDED